MTDSKREILEGLYGLAFYSGLDGKYKGPKGKEWIDKNGLTVDQALTKLNALEPKIDEEALIKIIDNTAVAYNKDDIRPSYIWKCTLEQLAKALIKDRSWLK